MQKDLPGASESGGTRGTGSPGAPRMPGSTSIAFHKRETPL